MWERQFIWHQEFDFLLDNFFSELNLFSNNEIQNVLKYEINYAFL